MHDYEEIKPNYLAIKLGLYLPALSFYSAWQAMTIIVQA